MADNRKTVVIAGKYEDVKSYFLPRKVHRETLIIAESVEDIVHLHRKDVKEDIVLLGDYFKNPLYKSEALKLLRFRLKNEPEPIFEEVSNEGIPST